MEQIVVPDYARRLFEAHGFKAIAEAAQKAAELAVKKRSSQLSSRSAAAVKVATTSLMPSRQPQIQTGSMWALPMANTDALSRTCTPFSVVSHPGPSGVVIPKGTVATPLG